ncbi:hypothetical protein F442_07335 [Phytophthora nicotianae P10297]|uniref:Uncharacterized protein n=2 Tax=Phytophthora nicotianae TaxID=4792 RepID=W2ZGE0_PHYNI|nr:hypothetical protein F444_07340 [Phytophthora nicotianae P1976]ETP46432.1 hypothetical protein F442_07335 [Phytophthora nicotianae P10297]
MWAANYERRANCRNGLPESRDGAGFRCWNGARGGCAGEELGRLHAVLPGRSDSSRSVRPGRGKLACCYDYDKYHYHQKLTDQDKIFPHLMSDDFDYDKEREWSRIAGRLVNQRLVMRGSVHFNWDGTSNRVMGLITQADMVSPLLQLLGNLEDVSRVFRRARINPESNIVPGEYLDQYTLSY